MKRARADVLAEKNYAKAFNAGLAAAVRVIYAASEDDQYADLLTAIDALNLPYNQPDVEALFTRRDVLVDKRKRTKDEESELLTLRERIEALPTGQTIQDQRMMDLIHRAGKLFEKKMRVDATPTKRRRG